MDPKLLLALLLLASATYAQPLITSPDSASICPCSTKAFEITISNPANTARTYTLSTAGSAGTWTTLTEPSLTLQPGEKRTTFAYLTAPCNAQPGWKTLEIKANYGTQSESQKTSIDVPDCYRLNAQPATQEITGCRGDILNNSLEITNKGKYSEIVLIDTGTTAAWTDPYAATIQPEERRKAIVYLNTSALETDTYLLNVSAASSRSPATANAALDYGIIACYNLSVAAPARMDACTGESEEMWAEADNLGIYNESATLTISAEGMPAIHNRTILLQPSERKIEKFSITTPTDGPETLYVALSTARSRAETTTELRPLDCNDFSASITPKFNLICPCQSGAAVLEITNPGKHQQNFTITTEGITSITTTASVEPYAKKELTLNLEAQCEGSKGQLTTTIQNRRYTRKIETNLTVPSFSSCYNADIRITPNSTATPRGKGEVLNVTISNTGLAGQAFSIEPFGGDWIFVNPKNVTVQPGENLTVYLYANPPATTKPDAYTLGVVATSKRQLTGGYAKIAVLNEVYTPPTPTEAIEPAQNQTNASAGPTGYAALSRKNIARTLAVIGIILTVLLILLISWKAKKNGKTTPETAGSGESPEPAEPKEGAAQITLPNNVTLETPTSQEDKEKTTE